MTLKERHIRVDNKIWNEFTKIAKEKGIKQWYLIKPAIEKIIEKHKTKK